MSVELAIKKAIAKEWEKEGIPANSSYSFRGSALIELDITVKRPEDGETTPKVDLIPVTVDMLAVLIRKAKLEPHQVKQFLLSIRAEATKDQAKLVRYVDEIDYTLEDIKLSIQGSLGKVKKAGNTQIRGIVRLKNIIPFEEKT